MKRDFITEEQKESVLNYVWKLVKDCGWDGYWVDDNDNSGILLMEVIEEKDLKKLLKKMGSFRNYKNSWEFEEGLKDIWDTYTEEYFSNYDVLKRDIIIRDILTPL